MAPPIARPPGGNGHGTGGNGREFGPRATKENPAPGSGPFGMALFLVSLGVLFLGSLVAYVVVRARAGGEWPPPDLPPPPAGLRVSTALILAGSVTIEAAHRALRRHRPLRVRASLAATLALALAFLASQTVCWVAFVRASGAPGSSLWAWMFVFLTALHAAHVIGGVVPLVVVTVNAFYSRLTPLRPEGLRYVAMYWHFLGGVWIVLWAMLTLGV